MKILNLISINTNKTLPIKNLNVPPVGSYRAHKTLQKSIKTFIKKEKDKVAVKQRKKVFMVMRLTEYNYSSRNYKTSTENTVTWTPQNQSDPLIHIIDCVFFGEKNKWVWSECSGNTIAQEGVNLFASLYLLMLLRENCHLELQSFL